MSDPPGRGTWEGRSTWRQRDDVSMAYPRPAFRLASPSQPRLNRLALASVIFALLWGFGIGSLLAIVFGVVAKRQTRRRRQSGRTLASVGVVLGAIGLVTTAVAGVLIVFFDDGGSVDDKEALADVVAAPCGVDAQTGTVAASLTVTNSADEASNYLITLEVDRADGSRAGEAFATAAQVTPGAAVTVLATSDLHELTTPSCTVAKVVRYPGPQASTGGTPATPAPAGGTDSTVATDGTGTTGSTAATDGTGGAADTSSTAPPTTLG